MFAISIQKIDKKIVRNNKFITIKFFFNNIIVKQSIKNIVIIEIYIINHFETNFLVNNNILILENIFIDFKNYKLIIDSCENLKIFIRVKMRKNFDIKYII